MAQSLQAFIDEYVQQLEPRLKLRNAAYWNFTAQGDEQIQQEYARLDTEIRQIHSDKARFEELKKLSAKPSGDALLDRQAQMMRNRAAREMGFANYYAMSLQLQELNEDTLFALFDRLEKLTRPLFTAYKADLDRQLADRFHLWIDQLRPWHYADPFFQDTPAMPGLNLDQYFADKDTAALARQFFQKIGMLVEDILACSDLYEREGKYQHAYCIDIDRKGDVLNKLWWDLIEKFQMLKRPEGRNQPDWVSKIHIACYPAYYQNYMQGEMTASQLLEFINTEVLGGHTEKFVDSPEVGKYLVNKYFKHGSRFDWNGLLKESTGEELQPEYFAKHLQ